MHGEVVRKSKAAASEDECLKDASPLRSTARLLRSPAALAKLSTIRALHAAHLPWRPEGNAQDRVTKMRLFPTKGLMEAEVMRH